MATKKGFIKVRFTQSYSASRGAAISGVKDAVKEIRMSEQLQGLLDSGICELVKKAPAAKREKAVSKKGE